MKENDIINYLLENNIRPSNEGFYYLVDAIEIASEIGGKKPAGIIRSMVAQKHGNTMSRVERCMRYAIDKSGFDGCFSDFIALAVLKLRMRENDSNHEIQEEL